MGQVKIGALCWNQYTEWPRLLAAGIRADELGYDSLWTWDHLYPIVGDSHGPELRGLADDHGLGAGDDPGPDRPDGQCQHVPRARALGEAGDHARPHLAAAAPSSASARRGSRRSTRRSGSSSGRARPSDCGGWARRCRSCAACSMGPSPRPRARAATRAKGVRNLPGPVQDHLPICIGGGGEKVTLKLVASYADMNNVGGGIENVRAQGADPAPALRDRWPRPGRDRADEQHRQRHDPGQPGGGRARLPRGVRAQPGRPALDRSAGRHARGRRGAAGAVRRTSATGT